MTHPPCPSLLFFLPSFFPSLFLFIDQMDPKEHFLLSSTTFSKTVNNMLPRSRLFLLLTKYWASLERKSMSTFISVQTLRLSELILPHWVSGLVLSTSLDSRGDRGASLGCSDAKLHLQLRLHRPLSKHYTKSAPLQSYSLLHPYSGTTWSICLQMAHDFPDRAKSKKCVRLSVRRKVGPESIRRWGASFFFWQRPQHESAC